jgi:hypothetical protein
VLRRHRSQRHLLGRLDELLAEARDLCTRADELCTTGSVADAFQTVLAQPTRDWVERAEMVVDKLRPGSDDICNTRTEELRALVDDANVAIMRLPTGREAWSRFYRSVVHPQDQVT